MWQISISKRFVAVPGACGLLKVLGNPDRLVLLCLLTQGEHCVSDLASATGIVQPTLS
jgi:ArsR family transcriptional regulator